MKDQLRPIAIDDDAIPLGQVKQDLLHPIVVIGEVERALRCILRVGVMNSLGNNNHLLAGLELSPDPTLKAGHTYGTSLTPKTKCGQPKEGDNVACSHVVP
jgi:hypothetical protein